MPTIEELEKQVISLQKEKTDLLSKLEKLAPLQNSISELKTQLEVANKEKIDLSNSNKKLIDSYRNGIAERIAKHDKTFLLDDKMSNEFIEAYANGLERGIEIKKTISEESDGASFSDDKKSEKTKRDVGKLF